MSVQVQLRRDVTANIAANHGAAGEVFVDTTVNRLVVQDGSTTGGWPAPITLLVGNSGTTNNSNSGSGSFVNHTPTFTIPANFMIAARVFRVTAHFQLTTGSGPPTLTFRLTLGATVIYISSVLSPTASMTNVQTAIQWIFQATAAPGASVNVQCAAINQGNTVALGAMNQTAMPVSVATNAAQAVTIATEWTTGGTGTNTIGINQFILEALN
jgi:Major tropism determinant N-terminal domain